MKNLKSFNESNLNQKFNLMQIPKNQLNKIVGGSTEPTNGEIEDYQIIVIDL